MRFSISVAIESFVDVAAAKAKGDPREFRLRYWKELETPTFHALR